MILAKHPLSGIRLDRARITLTTCRGRRSCLLSGAPAIRDSVCQLLDERTTRLVRETRPTECVMGTTRSETCSRFLISRPAPRYDAPMPPTVECSLPISSTSFVMCSTDCPTRSRWEKSRRTIANRHSMRRIVATVSHSSSTCVVENRIVSGKRSPSLRTPKNRWFPSRAETARSRM